VRCVEAWERRRGAAAAAERGRMGLGAMGIDRLRPGRERNMRWVSNGRDFRFPLFPRPALIMFLQKG
jgi:hypothetical protein